VRLLKTRIVEEFGDFQTPIELAKAVAARALEWGIHPAVVVEPTCGVGNLLLAAAEEFLAAKVMGYEINPEYASLARERLMGVDACARLVDITVADFFGLQSNDLTRGFDRSILYIGNPPWVTSSAIGALGGENLPVKSNRKGLTGMEARTGKSNFDISQWILERLSQELQRKSGWLVMIVKTSVAKKVLHSLWSADVPIARSAIVHIDANEWFGVSVAACVLMVEFDGSAGPKETDVYRDLGAVSPSHRFGLVAGLVIDNPDQEHPWMSLVAKASNPWRSGVKHDCRAIMELSHVSDDVYVNGEGTHARLEPHFLFPLVRATELYKGTLWNRSRFVLLTQRNLGEDTAAIRYQAPLTWDYLNQYAARLRNRGSSIYKKQPEFAVFGVGDYTFTDWKVAVSALHKSPRFRILPPTALGPVVVDDTCLLYACRSADHAQLILQLLESELANQYFAALMQDEEKRPLKSSMLTNLSLERLAEQMGLKAAFHQVAASETRQIEMF
jgi:hypothetical protein